MRYADCLESLKMHENYLHFEGVIQKVCIFGYGYYGKLLYDSIKQWNADIYCIFCDNDTGKCDDDSSDKGFEIISPQIAAKRVEYGELDAVVIPGASSFEF